MSFVYLAILAGGLACMAMLDVRFRLVFAAPGRAWRAAVIIALGLAFFLLWDLAGIGLGVFHRGENPVSSGVLLAPELPLEELVFLAFLCYLTLVLYTGALRVLAARAARRAQETGRAQEART